MAKSKKAPIPNPVPVALTKRVNPNPQFQFKGMSLPQTLVERMNEFDQKVIQAPTSFNASIATANASRQVTSVELRRTVDFVNFTQPPYTDGDLQRFEGAARRNLAVRAAITIREHFAFGRPSKLVIELNESDKLDRDEDQQTKYIEQLTKEHMKILKKITDLDEKVDLVENAKGPFYWQNIIFGRGTMVKIYQDEEYTQIKKLMPVNTRRLGLNILDDRNNMEFEGVYIDGTAVDRLSLIYGVYQDKQISPYTEHYGYSAIEPIQYIAQSHNVAMEEDIPEILKSAWLKAILFVVNTAGLDAADARAQIQTIMDAIDPGKYVGVNSDIKEAIPLDLDPDFEGIIKITDSQESKIFKSLHVPQFLAQSEDMANMATANKSASLFIDGIVAHDQEWMGTILWKQWYEPLLRRELDVNADEEAPDDPEKDFVALPFKIKRQWDKPTVEEFTELADALTKLTGAKIWDTEQANKILQTPDVAKRVAKAVDEAAAEQTRQMDAASKEVTEDNTNGESPIGIPNQPDN